MRAFLIAGCIAALMFGAGASAEERDCHCSQIVLNGSLNTADFDGGVGGVVDDGAYGSGGGYASADASTQADAFARARAFSAAFSRGRGSHGNGGHHGGCGGGHGGHR